MRSKLQRHLEALLFSAGEPVAPEALAAAVREGVDPHLSDGDLADAIAELQAYYRSPNQTLQLHFTGGGWRLLTKADYFPTLSAHFKLQSGKRLSRAALETLSIVAYRQPITRADLEAIRGVGAGYALTRLLERELIAIVGRDAGPGRPLLYGTSPQFMDYFGLGSLADLPKLRELGQTANRIGEASV